MAERDNIVSSFVQKTGTRKGQQYRVKRGASGQLVRIYGSGETAAVGPKPTGIQPARHGGVLVGLGTGKGAAGGPRAGKSYRAYYARGKGTEGTEYHEYSGGKVVGFKRSGKTASQRQALVNRFKKAFG